jgi:hypothetical protein
MATNTSPLQSDVTTRAVVRHLAATLAYRAAKVLRDAPPGFPRTSFGDSTRKPVLIVAHMADLMTYSIRLVRGELLFKAEGSDDWTKEVARFFDNLSTLDRELASNSADFPVEKLIQGPLADALTHVGQLAMLRGMAGAPVRPESYARAQIVAGRVGLEQAPPGREFDGDASAPTRAP